MIARLLGIPYPIVLVLGAIPLGYLPGVPDVELDPDLVLVIFLPPLLYVAAFFADLRALRADARALSLTSIGLVLVTTCAVAVVGHELIDLPWAVAFALGAIVSPTDPVAATAIARQLGVPRRLVNVIEGESLVNDSSALIAYRVAVAAAIGGSFSLFDASVDFVVAVVGGIAIGLVVGAAIAEVRRRLDDIPVEITISIFSGFAAYLPAEELGVSGVLAAVTTGIYLGWLAPQISTAQMRIQGFAVWELIVFLLNAVLFVLIGLQLPSILDAVSGIDVATLAGYALATIAVVVGTRFAVAVHDPVPDPGARPPPEPGRAPGRRRPAGGHGLGRDARRGLARRGARAAAGDRRGRAVPRARPGDLPRLLRRPVHGRRPGADAAGADPPAGGGRRRHRGGGRGARGPNRGRRGGARGARRARRGGVDARGHRRADAGAVRVPPPSLRHPARRPRGRGRDRRPLARLPAPDARA